MVVHCGTEVVMPTISGVKIIVLLLGLIESFLNIHFVLNGRLNMIIIITLFSKSKLYILYIIYIYTHLYTDANEQNFQVNLYCGLLCWG